MGLGLAEYNIGEDLAWTGRVSAHHSRSGFIAAGFNAQDNIVTHAALLYAECKGAAMRILVTRPLAESEEIAARLAERGHQALVAPLLTLHFPQGPEPKLDDVRAILATSANGIRALVRRSARRDLCVFAVGPQTALQAQTSGFTQVRHADGDAVALAEAVTRWAEPRDVLLHVCGQDAPATLAESLTLKGFTVRRAPLYAIEPASQLPRDAQVALRDKLLVGAMFFSPRSANVFRTLAEGLPMDGLTAFCISPASAQALAPMAFARTLVAHRPNQAAMLALLD
jgi:uroporphyrinogen-III synthase